MIPISVQPNYEELDAAVDLVGAAMRDYVNPQAPNAEALFEMILAAGCAGLEGRYSA